MAKHVDSVPKPHGIKGVIRGSALSQNHDGKDVDERAPISPNSNQIRRDNHSEKNPPLGDFLSPYSTGKQAHESNKGAVPSYVLEQCIAAEKEFIQRAEQSTHIALNELWLAVSPHELALQSYLFITQTQSNQAIIIYENHRVVALSEMARKSGVHAGMPLAMAMSLTEDCTLLKRRPLIERKFLKSIALMLEHFSDEICITTKGVVLEIGRSIGLFKGIEPMVNSIWSYANTSNIALTMGADKTIQKALWQSTAHEMTMTGNRSITIRDLPISSMELNVKEIERLQAMGLYRYGDLKRLPQRQFSERITPEFREVLARAEGEKPDTRRRYRRTRKFALKVEFDYPIDSLNHLMPVMTQAIKQLSNDLKKHHRGVRNIAIGFVDIDRKMSWHIIRLTQLVYAFDKIMPLVTQKLQGLVIASPIDGFCIITGPYLHIISTTADLFSEEQCDVESLTDLLLSRLGDDGLLRILSYSDHLPERQTLYSSVLQQAPKMADSISVPSTMQRLPPWLFERPVKIDQLRIKGERYTLNDYPIRIETGWWRNEWCSRDYYLATTERGKRFWIFYQNDGWYVHGQFF